MGSVSHKKLLFMVAIIGQSGACSLLFDERDEFIDDGKNFVDAGMIDAPTPMEKACPHASNVGEIGVTDRQEMHLAPGVQFIIDTDAVNMTKTIAGGHRVAILPLRSLTIDVNATLRAVGSLPLVILVDGDVRIAGTIDVSSRGSMAGSGGFLCGAAGLDGIADGEASPALAPLGNGRGGAGGSFGGEGGVSQLGMAADVFGKEFLVPLMGGGSGSGGRAESGNVGAAGGHGGGAIQISASGTIEVTDSGEILAGGGGGEGGDEPDNNKITGGGGGGAGGAILLEARIVSVAGSAKLAVHGGSGGSGNLTNGSSPGIKGMTGPASKLGTGMNMQSGHRSGAAGSDDTGTGTNAVTPMGSYKGGGGAGGGAGRIRINHQGSVITATETTFFPVFSFSQSNNWCD